MPATRPQFMLHTVSDFADAAARSLDLCGIAEADQQCNVKADTRSALRAIAALGCHCHSVAAVVLQLTLAALL